MKFWSTLFKIYDLTSFNKTAIQGKKTDLWQVDKEAKCWVINNPMISYLCLTRA